MNDLDWLARNVHEWKHADCDLIRRVIDVAFYGESKNHLYPREQYYTRNQWQTRRAELQNKPSWDDAPEWAEWLAFDAYMNEWRWHEVEPELWDGNGYWASAIRSRTASNGSVLGDWRNTLECRPETEPASNQWTGPEDGLPPVGTRCLVNGAIHHKKLEVVILYMDEERGVYLAEYEIDSKCKVNYISQSCFHPIPTKEDKAVEEMMGYAGELLETAARALYRAGYRKLDTPADSD